MTNTVKETQCLHCTIFSRYLHLTQLKSVKPKVCARSDHRCLKFGPRITYIVSKPNVHSGSNDIANFCFLRLYISDMRTELYAPVIGLRSESAFPFIFNSCFLNICH